MEVIALMAQLTLKNILCQSRDPQAVPLCRNTNSVFLCLWHQAHESWSICFCVAKFSGYFTSSPWHGFLLLSKTFFTLPHMSYVSCLRHSLLVITALHLLFYSSLQALLPVHHFHYTLNAREACSYPICRSMCCPNMTDLSKNEGRH